MHRAVRPQFLTRSASIDKYEKATDTCDWLNSSDAYAKIRLHIPTRAHKKQNKSKILADSYDSNLDWTI